MATASRKRRAFTLIELLVVIAILSILAAIIFPTFAKARASARQAGCISNLKQIGAAVAMYMTDFDDLFPHAVDAADKFQPEIWRDFPEYQRRIPDMPMLHEVLQPYIKSRDAFRCPSDTGGYVLDTHPWMPLESSPSTHATFGSSYMFRTEIAFKFLSQSQFQLPSNVNVLFDASGHWHGSTGPLRRENLDSFLDLQRGYRYNTLFGDLSVKNITFDGLERSWQVDLQ